MTQPIRLSVVIPTHNRVQRLRDGVLALARQSAPSDSYEIVVVADGCTDGTAETIAALAPDLPCRLLVTSQRSAGAAQARNQGASLASGDILLFLDDDMEAAPGLVAAHLAAHQDPAPAVVLGRFWTPAGRTADPVADGASRWWAECATTRALPGHRFNFFDVFTGNLSLPKQLFARVGGFNQRIGSDMSGEDYELGIRLIEAGARFALAPDAASAHHDRPTRRRALARAEQDGRGQAQLTLWHPDLFWQFKVRHLGPFDERPLLAPISRLLWSWPGTVRTVATGLARAVGLAESLGRRRLARQLFDLAHGCRYHLGAQSIITSHAAWQRLRQDAPLEPADCREIEIDLALDFDRLDRLLATARPDAVRLSHRGTPIFRINPVFGAEPIRGGHVRRELLRRAPGLMLGLLLEDRPARSAA